MNLEKILVRFCRKFGRFMSSKASAELRDSMEFLGWDINPDLVLGGAKLAMALTFVILASLSGIAFFFGISPIPFIVLIPFSIAMFYAITEWPKSLAKQNAVRSLGHAPYIVAQLSVSLKQTPNLENAMSFVANYGEGDMARDFKRAMWSVWSGKTKDIYSSLEAISKKWGRFSGGFQRSVHLVKASFFEKDIKRKFEMLDKTIEVMLDDITSRMREYAMDLHMPTLVLFSLGTIVPLMVISIFPLVSFFGFQISPVSITGFLALSLVACFLYSNMVMKKRPATFSSAEVKASLPPGYLKVGKSAIPSTPLAVAAGLIIGAPGIFYVLSKTGAVLLGPMAIANVIGSYSIIWAIGIAVSIHFYGQSAHLKKEREKVKRLETQFVDSLYHIKNHLSDGRPIESAVDFAKGIMSGTEIKGFLERILNNMKRRSMTLEIAAKEVDSGSLMIRSAFEMIANSIRKGGKAAAQTADMMHQYMTRIRDVERELSILLSKSLSMMKATVLFFAPIVCAIIVVLFQLITNTVASAQQEFGASQYMLMQIFTAPAISPDVLALIVGIYVIALNYVLIRYVSRIRFGVDSVSFKFEVSKSIPITLVIFTATLLISQAMLVGRI